MVQMLIKSGASREDTDNDGSSALLLACRSGALATVQWLLSSGSRIDEVDKHGRSALLVSAYHGQLSTVKWLLGEGGSKIDEVDTHGDSALLRSAIDGELPTVQFLLEYGGSKVTDAIRDGKDLWALLEEHLLDEDEDAATVSALLKVVVLQQAPPAELIARLSPIHARIVEEGARLKARLPAYLAKQQPLLDAHCPLPAPLRILVHYYMELTTTEEIWATGIGTILKRPRFDEANAPDPRQRLHARVKT
jgi:ankyrin repeat protein